MQRIHGSRTGPPADMEYAVEPVGVDITIPSERMDCAATPFAKRSKERSFETGPFESTTSLSAGYSVRSTSSPRITETSSIIRSSISHFPEMIFSISPSSDTSSSARYPSLPKLIPTIGIFRAAFFLAAEMIDPSPPRTNIKSIFSPERSSPIPHIVPVCPEYTG